MEDSDGDHGLNAGTFGALLDDWDGKQGRATTNFGGYRTNIESTIRPENGSGGDVRVNVR